MTTAPLPPVAEFQAPGAWRSIEFVSDLHLQAEAPATFDAWRRYMGSTQADAVFMLGDIFEVWIGDDAVRHPGFASDCAAIIQAASRRAPVFVMHGNRDFLLGDGMLRACGATLLPDPTVLGFLGRRWLLTHGDALCTGDESYMQFRAQVRDAQWQANFLAKPYAEREAIGREMRAQSEAKQREARAAAGFVDYGQVDEASVLAWLDATDAQVMIHGHTHQPRDHELPGGRRRIVLTDWEAGAMPPRLEVLRLSAAGAQRVAPGA